MADRGAGLTDAERREAFEHAIGGIAAGVTETVTTEENDLRLVVMAAVAFNMNLSPRTGRSKESEEQLWAACERVGATVGLVVDNGYGVRRV